MTSPTAIPDEVILHVGMTKAGSTAIQNMMDRNHERLLDQGVLFPRSVLMRGDPAEPDRTPGHLSLIGALREGETGAFVDECAAHSGRARTLLLSAENLFHHIGEADLTRLRAFLGGRDVTMIAILREQAGWLNSIYYEWVVKGIRREARPPDDFAEDMIRSGDLDYAARLDVLAGQLRPTRTHVLDYDRLRGEGSLVARFCEAAGVDLGALDAAGTEGVNRSEPFPEAIEAQRRLNPATAGLDRAEYRAWSRGMRGHYRTLARVGTLRPGHLMPSPAVRRRLLDRVAGPNEALAGRWLAGDEGARFGPDPAWDEEPAPVLDEAVVELIHELGWGGIAGPKARVLEGKVARRGERIARQERRIEGLEIDLQERFEELAALTLRLEAERGRWTDELARRRAARREREAEAVAYIRDLEARRKALLGSPAWRATQAALRLSGRLRDGPPPELGPAEIDLRSDDFVEHARLLEERYAAPLGTLMRRSLDGARGRPRGNGEAPREAAPSRLAGLVEAYRQADARLAEAEEDTPLRPPSPTDEAAG